MKSVRLTKLALVTAMLIAPFAAQAFEAPPGQVHLTDHDILRGHFTQTRDGLTVGETPPTIEGHFVVVPARGLLWDIEVPFPTDTVVTAAGMKQNFGGMMIKVPARNLHHIYDMVGGALRGDWTALADDFNMTVAGDANHWSVSMVPKDAAKSPFRAVTVTGAKFLQGIAVMNTNGVTDRFSFTNEALSPAPPNATEQALFDKAS